MEKESLEVSERIPELPSSLDQPKQVPAKGPLVDWRSQLAQPLLTVGLRALFSALETLLVRRQRQEVALAQEARDNERHER